MTEPIHSGRVLQGERQRKARRTTRSGRVLIAAVAIVVGGFLLVGCGSETTTTNAGADVAPDLRLTSINGERVALSDYLGQPVAVIFMHSY
jgi:cytochrome oxidase Cu insertion factor (SCO1/SenC/PrrC family)